MKKQLILTTVFLLFTLLSFSQHEIPTCTADAFSPAIGVGYNYSVSISGDTYAGSGTYKWYVTQGLDLINSTPLNNNVVFVASGDGAYNTDKNGSTANTITITWSSAALASTDPYYLVVIYSEANSASTATPDCSSNNIKVYKIVPKNAFYLMVDNITTDVCPAPVAGAVIQGNGTVTYDYGKNTLQFTITAGGYLGNWDGQVKITGLLGNQSIESVKWAATRAGSTGDLTLNGANYEGPLPSFTNASGDSETITITVVINNNQFEHLTAQTLTLAVDGSYSSGLYKDLSNVNGNCTPESDFADAITQTILARPNVAPGAGTFVTQN